MLILADHQLTGEILGKPFYGKTLPPAEGGMPPVGLFHLSLPSKDPVFDEEIVATNSAIHDELIEVIERNWQRQD